MIGNTNRHRRSHRFPLFWRPAAFGQQWREDIFSQATMYPTKMVVTQAEVKLTLHPVVFLGEAQGLASESSILMAHRAVLSFHESGVEMLADGRAVQVSLQHG